MRSTPSIPSTGALAIGGLLLGQLNAPAYAQAPAAAAAATPAATVASSTAAAKSEVQFFGSWRVREEVWDWFGDFGGPDTYAFTGSTLRFGGAYSTLRNDLTLELSAPMLLGHPKDASLLPPLGQLGFGAGYRDANGPQQAAAFVKQGFWRYKGMLGRDSSLRLGRFEFIDGAETAPKDASLAWLKRERIAHRMIGNFGWSYVQRSFDGAEFVHKTPKLNVTLMGAMPTQGGFDLDGNDTLHQTHVIYGSATAPYRTGKLEGEGRLFALYYGDSRDGVIKTDNRPLPVRTLDAKAIRIGTFGGHLIAAANTPAGKVDGLVWGAGQFGAWGAQDHRGYAGSLEAGFQPKGLLWKPWLRGGFSHFSGDGDPANNTHSTFMPGLPTPRVYARFPFYTEMNLNDAFVQLLLRPHPKVNVRGDLHFLSLANRNDLWYGGGGAFQDQPSFGYNGRPSGGVKSLGTLYDVSVDYQFQKSSTLSLYFGYATGSSVIRSTYPVSPNGFMGYVEMTHRW